jgi:hypothetical protein
MAKGRIMAYSDFTLKAVTQQFKLTLHEEPDLFAEVAEVGLGTTLQGLLKEYLPLALAINSEKARSELLIAPILVEVRAMLQHQVSLFSGVDFTVDIEQGLNGFCDFILTRSVEQQFIAAPAVTVVEAKNENLKSGLGQCVAAMVGARLFNEREKQPAMAVHGIVTTGTLWRFLRLADSTVILDQHEYHIDRLGKILGILVRILRS